jgi:O-antigen ligase
MFNALIPKTSFGAGIPDLDAFRIASYLLLLGSMFHWSIKKDIRLFNRWIIALALFYIIVFASVTWSNFNYNKTILRNLFDGAFIPLFIAFVAIHLFRKENNKRIYIINIIIAASILALISVFQLALAISEGSVDMRATGTFKNPNNLAIILVLSIPCLLHAKEHHFIPKWFGWFATISIVSGIICTVSRKGIITMIICFCLYNLLKKRYKNFFYLMIVFILIGASLSSFTIVSGRFESSRVANAFETKLEMTHAGLKMFIKNPIYGLGYEGYKDHYNQYLPFSSQNRYDAHNMFITALSNYGIIGFVPFMAIFLFPLIASYKTFRKKKNNDHSSNMAIICLSSVIPFMLNGWFQGGLFYSVVEISLFYSNVSLFLASRD